ncbi:ras suppressor protein 1-like [Sycon ciliatum]|uniref:ras suppressor protein 1-like n=1 Tax=Sycon ciliatum TaxID=27933 RepID=UPI0020A8F5AB|eukprot:scpid67509/ scgid24731/ Ras suppressor protein 1
MSKSVKKLVEDAKSGKANPLDKNDIVLDVADRGISDLTQVPAFFSLSNVTRVILSHNKLGEIPHEICDLRALESLNLFNNHIEELPTSISTLSKLRHLNLGLNRLCTLPKGFGAFACLEVLDLSYNNLSSESLPGNFFYMATLRALYLSDNDFHQIPDDVSKLKSLQVLSLRDNDLTDLPPGVSRLGKLKELHLQSNHFNLLPPELSQLDFSDPTRTVFKANGNPLIPELQERLTMGVKHLFDFLRSPLYARIYQERMGTELVKFVERDRSARKSRKTLQKKRVQ